MGKKERFKSYLPPLPFAPPRQTYGRGESLQAKRGNYFTGLTVYVCYTQHTSDVSNNIHTGLKAACNEGWKGGGVGEGRGTAASRPFTFSQGCCLHDSQAVG